MINTFIAAIVALFFWGKSTKDVEEKTQLASWIRTIVYGVLAFVVLVFYIKTYQVATVYNGFEIKGIRSSIDTNGNNTDTIKVIRITNRISSGITENIEENKLKNNTDGNRDLNYSGIYILQEFNNGDSIKTKSNKKVLNDPYSVYKSEYKNIAIEDYSHLYQINTLRSVIPSVIPFFPSFFEEETHFDNSGVSYFLRSDLESYGKRYHFASKLINNRLDGGTDVQEGGKEAFRETVMYTNTIGDTLKTDKSLQCEYIINEFVANAMNFFTAADISQYSLAINIDTDCYIENLIIVHDVPIEMEPFDSCMTVSSHGIFIKDKYINETLANKGGIPFHIKLPTLENMQLIRSLVLTTILTALVSMFFCNIYYLLRKYALAFRESHVSQISEVRVKRFKIKMYIMLFVALGIMLYITLRILQDTPFHIPENILNYIYGHYIAVFALVTFVIGILIYIQFRNAYTIKKKK